MNYESLEAAAQATGLVLRGAFYPGDGDAVPSLPGNVRPQTLVLLGNAGGGLWPQFSQSPEHLDGRPDALNRWSQRVIDALAAELSALALYPFGGPPYHPFIAWAKRAEPVFESPLGIMIHPDYGLWHAYRGALAFAERIELPPPDRRPSPCDSCQDKPCLTACPVSAFGESGYSVGRCLGHISTPAGEDCMEQSCRARRACPVGLTYRYDRPQSEFHMTAFLRSQQTEVAE